MIENEINSNDNEDKIQEHGNIKWKLNQILSVEAIQSLKTEMKSCVKALTKAEIRKNGDPFETYIKERDERHMKSNEFESQAPKSGNNLI